jgi:hypothetical protein
VREIGALSWGKRCRNLGNQIEQSRVGSRSADSGGQYRLAAMDVRSVLEHMVVAKVGDQQTFGKTLGRFQEAGSPPSSAVQ